jgi:tripeptidyl-peptidase I
MLRTMIRYGVHLTKKEADSLVVPHPDSVELVESWLEYHKVNLSSSSYQRSGKWMIIRLQVADADRLLQSKYQVFQSSDSDSFTVRTLSYSLPRILHDHISMVAPTTYFGGLRPMRAIVTRALDAAVCNITITPSCLRSLYHSADYTPMATAHNRLGITGYLNQFPNADDLNVKTVFPTITTSITNDLCRSFFSRVSAQKPLEQPLKSLKSTEARTTKQIQAWR